jgi:ABC-type multidrug transport system fused ATPase/permease subunit
MRNQKKAGVISALKAAVRSHRILTVSTLLCVAASVAASLIPPLLLKNIIDRLTGGMPLLFTAVLLYFGSLVLEGTLSSAQETLLVLFGQKMTHALRSEMSQKLIALPASTLVGQNPGEVAARFSGDVDAVEALFTSGIISMVADACRIISILAVIAVENTGLALVRSWRTVAPSLPCPGRYRKRCTTSAPFTPWGWKATWSSAMTSASAKAMPRWKKRISMTRFTRPSCFCLTPPSWAS